MEGDRQLQTKRAECRIRKKKKIQTALQHYAVAQWLKCCATNRKVAGSIPVGVSGIFH